MWATADNDIYLCNNESGRFLELIPLTCFSFMYDKAYKKRNKQTKKDLNKWKGRYYSHVLPLYMLFLLPWKNDPWIQLLIWRPLSSLNWKFLSCKFYTSKTKVVSQIIRKYYLRRQKGRIRLFHLLLPSVASSSPKFLNHSTHSSTQIL